MNFLTSVNFLLMAMTSVVMSVRFDRTKTISDQLNPDGQFRRFLMTHHANMPWMSWRQHVACLTTCVPGYEAQTVACCTTGDNRLCFNLPFALLNNSVGSCPDFCQRKTKINCGTGSKQVCGSDGITYQNMCEFSKAVCDNDKLMEVSSDQCSTSSTKLPTTDPILAAFCLNKNSITCGTDLSPICTNTKSFYLNKCEYSKGYCDDNSLQEMPYAFCTGHR